MAQTGGWTGLDRWTASGDNSAIAEQAVRLTQKGKCSAFGEAVVGAGRAEWDLTIEFESFGGISIGVFRQDVKSRDNLNALPTDETFTYTPDGYGYANKTGAFTTNRERKKYGQRYRHGDKITVRLDLTARTLHFLINDEDQGVAYDGLPKGAYRLAACMQFKEQKVVISRFWTSLGKDATIPNIEATQTVTAEEDKVGKEHEKDENEEEEDEVDVVDTSEVQEKAQELYAEYKEPEIDPDAPMFGDDYDDGRDDDDEEEEEEEEVPEADDAEDADADADAQDEDAASDNDFAAKSDTLDEDEARRLDDLESSKPTHASRVSMEDISEHLHTQYDERLEDQLEKLENLKSDESDADDQPEEERSLSHHSDHMDPVGLIGGRSRGLSEMESKVPEPLAIESVDEGASDFFSLCGGNLKTDRSSVTCTRSSNGNAVHSAFGTQLVSRGRIEWMLQLESGHSVRIGVCGLSSEAELDGSALFTDTQYGYGYGDDGSIYYGGSRVEYNEGFKAGQIVGVYLNMDMNTLKFSVDGKDHGLAFDAIKLSDKDGIIGYRLAVAITHRPHKIELLESTLYNVERRSPRPEKRAGVAHQGISSLGSDHRRKLSFTSMNSKKLAKGISAEIGQSTPKEEEKEKAAEVKESVEEAEDVEEAPKKKKKKKKDKDGKKAKGKKKVKDEGGIESTSVLSPAKSKKGKKGKKKKDDAAKASKKKKKKASDKGTGTKSKKKKDKGDKPKKSKKKKKKASADEEEKEEKESGSGNGKKKWRKREPGTKDKWEHIGAKLVCEKQSVWTRTNIKDGNSVFGRQTVKAKMKARWEVSIKQGDNMGVGVCNLVGGLKSAKNRKLLAQSFTNDINGYGYMGNDGGTQRSGRYRKYGEKFKAGDKVQVTLDMKAKTLSFALNGKDQGVAFKNLPDGEYRLAAVLSQKAQKIMLNKCTLWDAEK